VRSTSQDRSFKVLPGEIHISLLGVVDHDTFKMFGRAELWLDGVTPQAMATSLAVGLLVGRLGLSDDEGSPLCAAVRSPNIRWEPGDLSVPQLGRDLPARSSTAE
jgi:hypothetical protein